MRAKLPAIRDEAEGVGDTPGLSEEDATLTICAFRGIIADVERLASSSGAERETDPIFAAIEASRAARAARAAKDAATGPPSETKRGAARLRKAIDAHNDAWDRLLATPPTTIAGAQALARFAADSILDGVWDYTKDALVLFRAIGAVEVTSPAPDPIFAAIEASRTALRAHGDAYKTPDVGTKAGEMRADAACAASYRAWRALLATTPTTVDGALALARHALDHLERDGCWNNEDKEVDARTLFRAIAAVGALPSSRPSSAPALMAAE